MSSKFSEVTMTIAGQSGIYEIVNTTNGNRYVGSAAHFDKRWNGHCARLRQGKHHSRYLQAAWDKYGADAFEFKKLLICSKENLLMYEQALIDGMNPQYNVLRTAGNSLGRKATDETRKRIAAKATGRKRSPESVEQGAAKRRGIPLAPELVAKLVGNKHAAGTIHTPERKRAISEFMTGRPRPKSQEQRAKISASLTGRKATAEARANQVAAQLGTKRGPYNLSDEERKARSDRMQGRPSPTLGMKRTAEQIEKIASKNRGRRLSPARCQQIAATAKAMWADPATREKILTARADARALRKAEK